MKNTRLNEYCSEGKITRKRKKLGMAEVDLNNVSKTLLTAIPPFYKKKETRKAFETSKAEKIKTQLNKNKKL